jgi:transposase-like protein
VAAPTPPLRRERRKQIYTDEKLATIPALLEQGMTREQIAGHFGGKVNSLQVVCSKKGISLWRRDRTRKPIELPDVKLTLCLKNRTLERLQKRAGAVGLTESELASRLLNLIASENLFDAVLDEAAA